METNTDVNVSSTVALSEDQQPIRNATPTHYSLSRDPSLEGSLKNGNSDPDPPRLMITKMILENFKSYAGIKEIGPFHKCFSCVVGPNGSGKSNVIDAMLFVFGKRAKKLRLNKVSELIHSSETYKDSPLQYARVSVYFQEIIDTGDGQEDYIIVPNTEIVVTRVAKRDNSSNYRLNDKACSFKDVATYLDSKGIDLDNNRFLILQGEVEMISMMPPKGKADNDSDGGLLEYLEDIIGSNMYVEKTNECAKKLEILTEQRQEKFNRYKVALKEKDNLEAPKAEAEALLNKQGEIRRKKNILYQLNISQIQQDLDEALNKSEEIQQQLGKENAKNKENNGRMKEIEGLLSSKQTEYDILHSELVKTKEEFSAFERKDVSLREDIKHAKELKKKLESKVHSESKKREESSAKADAAERSLPQLEVRIKRLEQNKLVEDEKLGIIFEQMKETTESLRQDLEQKTQELAPISQERVILQAALDTAQTEQKLLEDMTSRAKDQLSSAENELATIDSVQNTKRNELAKCEDELMKSKQRLSDAEKEDATLAEEEEQFMKQSNELLVKAEEAKAAHQAFSGMNKAVAGILKAAQPNGELSRVGIHGRLGDLATIDAKYDVAISTSCGMLDHIVVDTTAGAQRCLDFLRRNNLGRASFIPLDKAPKGAHDRIVETPEGAPRLFDLITPTNFTATPALFLGVGNTLVSPDLETATRWAFDFNKRWRVVTLDGNLIESSGTMQGGGNSVKRGGMKLSGRSQNITTSNLHLQTLEALDILDMEAKASQVALKACREKRNALREEMRELNKNVKELSVKIPKFHLQVVSCDTTRSELKKIIPELREQCVLSVSDEQKLIELKTKVSKAKCDMASCALMVSKMEGEVARLQKAIVDAGGSILRNQQKSCDHALTELNQAVKELNSAKVTISSCRNTADKAMQNQTVAEKELSKCDESIEKLMDDLSNLDKDAMDVKMSYEEVKKLDIEKRDELDALHAEYEELKKVHSKMRCVELELMSKYDQCTKAVKEYEKNIYLWEIEISKLNDEHAADADYDLSDEEDEDHATETDSTSKLPLYSTAALSHYDINDVKREIAVLEKEREILAKNANMGAIAEYRKKEEDYLARAAELDEANEARNEARKEHEELRRLRLEKFMDGFGQITLKLKEMYQMITMGGDAELELVDTLDPFSEGIVFSVRPPKKSWKNISNLSGGEKTLSSLALVFALHHYKPTPLYVMDEIDAALDFKNVSIVANYIKDRTKNAQFIIISLRNNMFELADRLVGIYKTKNCTKSVTIDPKAFCDVMTQKLTPLGDATNMNGAPSSSLPCY